MSCFSCGKTFSGDVNALLLKYRKEYENNGIGRYFYRLNTNGTIFTCRASSFNTIFETQIKPNFDNGAEYGHISEYNRQP